MLFSPEDNSDYHDLVRVDLRRQLPSDYSYSNLFELDIPFDRLITRASEYALSNNTNLRRRAYDISARIIQVLGTENLAAVKSAEYILARLGNFPGCALLSRMFPAASETYIASLELEKIVREAENYSSDSAYPLTDFQCELLAATSISSRLSVSAPTSAGKSYALKLEILRRLHEGKGQRIVYVVPTRALLRQIAARLALTIRDAGIGDAHVMTAPLPAGESRKDSNIVYVLTQERLLNLLQLERAELNRLDLVIVDEAHGIAENARGVTLHASIDEATFRFPHTSILFASPMISNPEYLLNIFKSKSNAPSLSLATRESTVTQNIVQVNRVRGKPGHWRFELLDGNQTVYLDESYLPTLDQPTVYQRRAAFAKLVTKGLDCTIVYANGANDAEQIAEALHEQIDGKENLEDELEELRQFIYEQVHPDYLLYDTLRSRVAFHHSEIPSIVRFRIEELLEQGLIRYVCCTSTLLQGVNLPAKNIVLEKPSRGLGNPLNHADFRNLAGRAGRLTYEFQGNIWCLDAKAWREQSYIAVEPKPITAAYDDVIEKNPQLVSKAFSSSLARHEKNLGIAVASKAFLDLRINKRDFDREMTEELQAGFVKVTDFVNEVDVVLPSTLYQSHVGILPNKLNDLYRYLMEYEDLEKCLPIHPKLVGGKRRMVEVFRICQKYLEGVDNRLFTRHGAVAYEWVRERSLRDILEKFSSGHDEKQRTRSIRSIVRIVEHDLNYVYARNVRAFIDVLRFVFEKRGIVDKLVGSVSPLHIYLECGASEYSVLSLIQIGISRSTAILLYGAGFRVPSNSSFEMTLEMLRNFSIRSLELPAMCRAEIEIALSVGTFSFADISGAAVP